MWGESPAHGYEMPQRNAALCNIDSVCSHALVPRLRTLRPRLLALPTQFRSHIGAAVVLATHVRTVGSAAGACSELLEGDWDDDDGT